MTGQVTVGERRADVEADADALDGEDRARPGVAQQLEGGARVERHLVDDAVAAGLARVEAQGDRAVGAHGVAGAQAEGVDDRPRLEQRAAGTAVVVDDQLQQARGDVAEQGRSLR